VQEIILYDQPVLNILWYHNLSQDASDTVDAKSEQHVCRCSVAASDTRYIVTNKYSSYRFTYTLRDHDWGK